MFGYQWTEIRKFVLGAIGYILATLATTLPVDNQWRTLIVALLGLGTTYGIFRVPNSTPSLNPQQLPEDPSYPPSNVNVSRNSTDQL
jgi:hypothetical protein